ncbi:MAG: SurA N-terminal domain-containing protein [Treponema sp.]|nr:SurA N-terminal domain-containing protein [Treponema sp.]MBR7079026.1 SurA N-terminal domain-containing protein [Treponema sp.]
MKRIAVGIALIFSIAVSAFAQNDLQPLAVVKLNKSETITLKQLKTRASALEKQAENLGSKQTLTVDQRKQLLDTMIQEKLIVQAANKMGISISDSQVDAAFISSFSQQLGQQVTESQLSDLIKSQTGKTLNEFIQQSYGMSLADFKATIKNQLTMQQYVLSQKQSDLQKIAATDKEIRDFYDLNKSQLVRSDMLNLFLVVVPKGNDAVKAKATITDLRNQYTKDSSKEDSIKTSSDNGKTYQAGNILVQKSSAMAQSMGWSMDKLVELFNRSIGYVSPVDEDSSQYQFYVVKKKYEAKMLTLSDEIQPETTVTVYDYIKQNLTAQKQEAFLTQAIQDIAKNLDTAANVDRKKTGAELTKLLTW